MPCVPVSANAGNTSSTLPRQTLLVADAFYQGYD